MKRISQYMTLIICSFAISGCGGRFETNDRFGIDPQPEVTAPPKIKASITAFDGDSSAIPPIFAKNNLLHIQKAALEKEFLLMGSLIPQNPVPSFSGLKSRVVAFRKIGDKLYLLEASKGHQISEALPMTLLLAQFPIAAEDETSVVFDFNEGMSQVFTMGDWYASDDSGPNHKYNQKSAKVNLSFVQSIDEIDNQLVIRQIAQLESTGEPRTKDQGPISVEVKYFLSPYNPDRSFIPVRSPGLERVGFFEAAPLVAKDGSSLTYASKWNEKKPIVYAISANTPERLRGAIRDGILYWNKTLGTDHVQVIQLTDSSITAPNARYNVIQWVDWDLAEYAYADAQMDPRSGEILHAQIFLTSVFDVYERAKIIRELRYLEQTPSPAAPSVSLKGLSSKSLCVRKIDQKSIDGMMALLTNDAVPDAVIEKATLDYIREVVAHEVGHTLGLRHNFAGNLSANFTASETPGLLKYYVEHMKAPTDATPSSSVMEYEAFVETLITGDRMTDSTAPAEEYDHRAVGVLYKQQAPDDSIPPFCTDTEVGKYFDCNTFDSGKSTLEDSINKSSPKDIAKALLNAYIAAKAPGAISARPKKVEAVNLDEKKISQQAMKSQYKLMTVFSQKGRLVSIRRRPGADLSFKQEATRIAEKAWVTSEVERLGGFKRVLPVIPEDFAELTLAEFKTALSTHTNGREGDGAFTFDDNERAIMIKNVESFLPVLEKALRVHELQSIHGASLKSDDSEEEGSSDEKNEKPILWDSPLMFDLAQYLGEISEHYLLAKTSQTITGEIVTLDGTKKPVQLPVYVYPQDLRLMATTLFPGGRSEAPDWSLTEKNHTQSLFKKEYDVLGAKVEEVSLPQVSHEVARWITNNQALTKALE